jgi:RNA polymerase sigma factor (sigma-70 family)
MGLATDAELWRRAVEGSPMRSEPFSNGMRGPSTTTSSGALADWALAEDLTSIVFLEAWRKREKVRLEGELALPWLLGVATNVLRNRRRSQWRHRAALQRVPREHGDEFADDADARLDDERRMRAVLRSLADLPKREQDVVALCVWAELSYEEAASALELPIGTVRSRLSRARARMRELTAESGHEVVNEA